MRSRDISATSVIGTTAMQASRYAASRQKSCQPCSAAKAKCDRKPRCSRCSLRDLPCTYIQSQRRASATSSQDTNNDQGETPLRQSSRQSAEVLITSLSQESLAGTSFQNDAPTPPLGAQSSMIAPQTLSRDSGQYSQAPQQDTTDIPSLEMSDPALELVCPINADEISNRWLRSFIPIPGQAMKEYSPSITAFISRVLKSYINIAIRGHDVPPFIHHSQTTTTASPPLSTCLSLIRICQKPLAGSESVAVDLLQREMGNLYDQHGTFDSIALFAAFQAYLIYSMILYFRFSQGPNDLLRQAVMNLQTLACATSRTGLICKAEQQRARPRWEAWIIAEAKRRTLYIMYLFDSILSAYDGLSTSLGTELQGLLAPGAHKLWKARSRREWETAYNIYLADWMEDGLHIEELWPVPADLDEMSLFNRRSRVDQWLEGVDELGTMLYAVTSCTHGG